MKTTLSRIFATVAVILLLALMLIGTSFQLLVKEYLTANTRTALGQEAEAIANLAAVYAATDTLNSRSLEVNLEVLQDVTQSDILLCDTQGAILICVERADVCHHEGQRFPEEILPIFLADSTMSTTGKIEFLYEEERNLAFTPVFNSITQERVGFLLVSQPVKSSFSSL